MERRALPAQNRTHRRVIDELDADLLLLTEIENESVLRDLMLATSSDYNYIHRHTSDRRGMDIALLYRGSLIFSRARPSDRRAGTSPASCSSSTDCSTENR